MAGKPRATVSEVPQASPEAPKDGPQINKIGAYQPATYKTVNGNVREDR